MPKRHKLDLRRKLKLKTLGRYKWPMLGLTVLLLVVLGFIIFKSRAATFTSVTVPSSIKADCSVDVATQLNDWLDSLPNNTLVHLAANGCYRAESAIIIKNKVAFYVYGDGAKIMRTTANGQADGNYRHLHIVASSYVGVRDLTIVGQKKPETGYIVASEDEAGLALYGVSHATFDNLNISHVHGDFVYMNNHGSLWNTNITIENSTFDDAGRQGTAMNAVDTILFTHNSISGQHRSMFDFEVDGKQGGARNVTIDNNVVGGGANYFLTVTGGGPEVKNIIVSNNTVHRGMHTQVDAPDGKGFQWGPVSIINNVSDRGGNGTVIEMHGVKDGLIQGNSVIVTGVNSTGQPNNYLVQLFGGSSNFRIIANKTQGALATTTAAAGVSYCESNNTPPTPGAPSCNVGPSRVEAESGNTSKPANILSDPSASAGKYLIFR